MQAHPTEEETLFARIGDGALGFEERLGEERIVEDAGKDDGRILIVLVRK